MLKSIKKYVPGLLMLLAIALLSTYLAKYFPSYIGKVFIAVVIGIIIANTVPMDKKVFGSGIKLGLGQFLKIAIVLLGAGISFQEVAAIGSKGLLVVLVLMSTIFIITFLLGKIMNVSLRKKILIAVGVTICGNTAIVVTAPLIDAEEEEIAMAVGIVTLFGVIGVLLYPIIALAAGMSQMHFGAWAATAINDTSQVVAAGFIYGELAGKIATTIKLTRNIMIVPVVLIVNYLYRKNINNSFSERVNILKIFPTFILGFLALAVINSLNMLSPQLSRILLDTSKFLILLALSGIGLGVDFKKFKAIGLKPFILGFTVEFSLAVIALFVTKMVFV